MGRRHKVFVSYHHQDQAYKDYFERLFNPIVEDWSVRLGDIPDGLPVETIRQRIRDQYLRDATVIVVLVGQKTWQRKHVDWEIAAGLRDTVYNPRTGLLGVLLPTYSPPTRPTGPRITMAETGEHAAWPRPSDSTYDLHTVPKKLGLNVDGGFARMRPWTTDTRWMEAWIHEAFLRRNQPPAPTIGDLYASNQTGDRWYP